MAKLEDIARQAGVSTSTVSRVVNGKKYINSEKRAQILKLVEENGYIPNKAARNMAMQRSFTVGVVIPDAFNIFQRQLFSIIERYLNSFGYHTTFFFVKFDSSSEKACLNRLKAEQIDGVIMLHELKYPAFYEYAAKISLPVVSTLCNSDNLPTIKINDRLAATEAVNHLLGLGHKKINLICGCGFSFGEERRKGYYDALSAAGIDRDENRVICVKQYSSEFGTYGMKELLLRSRDFTAVFAASDELAIGAIRVLKDEGLRVPEDVSIIGFDNIESSNYYIPRLTTIHQPIEEIGEQAALGLHRRITGGINLDSEIIIPHKLIIRESTHSIAH
ncbi:MAG: LacI family transcriptional regulator [Spirochaetaceae bacterium]|jgi:LacI family transcriptional regulator|nr:LacI family transcriptional regulator [Spirochaetaceae bacterium]